MKRTKYQTQILTSNTDQESVKDLIKERKWTAVGGKNELHCLQLFPVYEDVYKPQNNDRIIN